MNDIEDLREDPHLKSVDFWSVQTHLTAGEMLIARNPLGMSASPQAVTRLPPMLSEHGAEILRACEYDDASAQHLLAPGGVCAPLAL